jgi:hypothetical protein
MAVLPSLDQLWAMLQAKQKGAGQRNGAAKPCLLAHMYAARGLPHASKPHGSLTVDAVVVVDREEAQIRQHGSQMLDLESKFFFERGGP